MDLLTEHWKVASGAAVTALTGWIVRRHPSGVWSWFIRTVRANYRVTDCEQRLSEKDRAILDRDQTITYLRTALTEITAAGELVNQARHRGLIRVSEPSASAPSPSPETSSPSPSKPVSIPREPTP